MTTSATTPATLDGREIRDILCIAPSEDLAIEIAAWLFRQAGLNRAYMATVAPLVVADGCDHPAVRGWAIWWPGRTDRKFFTQRGYTRLAIAEQFGGRGVRKA